MGYKKSKNGKGVINMVNERPFCASDAEHFLCKVWMIGKLTLAHYSSSKYPRPTNTHCHPVKHIKDVDPTCAEVDKVMESIRAAFKTQRSNLKTPNFCLLKGEAI